MRTHALKFQASKIRLSEAASSLFKAFYMIPKLIHPLLSLLAKSRRKDQREELDNQATESCVMDVCQVFNPIVRDLAKGHRHGVIHVLMLIAASEDPWQVVLQYGLLEDDIPFSLFIVEDAEASLGSRLSFQMLQALEAILPIL
jgi:hypothetical protein